MKILCIGDIVSRIGRDMLFKYVDDMKYQKGIDLVIANGENATSFPLLPGQSEADMLPGSG